MSYFLLVCLNYTDLLTTQFKDILWNTDKMWSIGVVYIGRIVNIWHDSHDNNMESVALFMWSLHLNVVSI